MTAGSWAEVMELCLQALDLPVEERAAFLERACEGRPALQREVEELLEHESADFLTDPLVRVDQMVVEAASGDLAPRHLGPYRIVRPLGQGGMGDVFLAVQEGDGFERPVALKVVRAGMASEDVVERFRLERRILAGLNHEHLARLIDGGATDDGRPYFVMEYVEGVPITEFCERTHASVEERLHLFMDVCDAVHHAHQSLVVHRDIKPSNILVTRDGDAKLLDFGIGKILDSTDPSRTRTRHRLLTPEYAAPEQVRGGAITTATDVYGLGLLLYELLSGQHPFSGTTTAAELDEAILTRTPAAPSQILAGAEVRRRRALRGDLDNIVLMAMRKEPNRRYPSAEALRVDVQRHLEGRTVRARPDSVRYRASKLVARNPWGTAAAAVLTLAVASAVLVPWQQNRRLSAERDKALAVQGFLLEGFGATGGDETIGARDLLDRQFERIEGDYGDRPELRGEMLLVVSDAYERLGHYEEAVESATLGLDAFRSVHGRDHADVARALNMLGWAQYQVGRLTDAAVTLEDAVAMRRRLGRPVVSELSRSLNDLGVVRNASGDARAAEELHREALSIRSEVLGDADLATGISASNLAATLYNLQDYQGALAQARRALELVRTAVGPDHQRSVIAQNNLAVYLVQAGDFEAAAAIYTDLLDRQTRLQGEDHPLTNTVRRGLSTTLLRLERFDAAEEMMLEALRFAEAQGEPGVPVQINSHISLSHLHEQVERPAQATAAIDRAVALAELHYTGLPPLEQALRRRSILRRRQGDLQGSIRDWERFVESREARLDFSDALVQRDRIVLGTLWMAAGDLARADTVFEPLRAFSALTEDNAAVLARADSTLTARRDGG